MTLRDYLVANRIVAISDIDTRALTRQLRSGGRDARRDRHRRRARRRRRSSIARARFRRWKDRIWCAASRRRRRSTGRTRIPTSSASRPSAVPTRRLKIAAYDFGMKWNILRRLSAHGCDVRVYPATTPASELLATQSGRRVPEQRPRRPGAAHLRDRQRQNAGRRRTCRCSASASAIRSSAWRWAATTFKLKFGHRGANHPVKKLATGKIEITSQNHGFAVDPASLPRDVEVTHVNLYDGTVEGLRHKTHPVFSRAVSSRGVARPARRGLSVRRLSSS